MGSPGIIGVTLAAYAKGITVVSNSIQRNLLGTFRLSSAKASQTCHTHTGDVIIQGVSSELCLDLFDPLSRHIPIITRHVARSSPLVTFFGRLASYRRERMRDRGRPSPRYAARLVTPREGREGLLPPRRCEKKAYRVCPAREVFSASQEPRGLEAPPSSPAVQSVPPVVSSSSSYGDILLSNYRGINIT
jgi:hypothetical protein